MNCTNCKSSFNLTSHKPFILSKCGHNICSQCIGKSSKLKAIDCSCGQKTEIKKIYENNSLMDAMSETKKCEKHKKDFEAFCDNDKTVLCVKCIIESEHKNHKLIAIDKAVKIQKEIFVTQLNSIKEKENFINIFFNEIDNKIKIIEDDYNEEKKKQKLFFDEIYQMIKKREEDNEEKITTIFKDQITILKSAKETVSKIKDNFSGLQEEEKVINQVRDIDFLLQMSENEKKIEEIKEFKIEELKQKLSKSENINNLSSTLNKIEEITKILDHLKHLQKKYQNITVIKPLPIPNKEIITNIKRVNSDKTENNLISTFNFVSDSSRSGGGKGKAHPQLFPNFKSGNVVGDDFNTTIKHNSTIHTLSLNLSINSDNTWLQSTNVKSPVKVPVSANHYDNQTFASKNKAMTGTSNFSGMFKRSSSTSNNIHSVSLGKNEINISIRSNNKEEVNLSKLDDIKSQASISISKFETVNDNDIIAISKEPLSSIILIGGKCDTVSRKYSVTENKWSCLNFRNIERSDFVCLVYKDKKYLIIGGKLNNNGTDTLSDSIELFNVEALTIDKLDFKMKSPRTAFGGAYVLSKLFICGGFDGKCVLDNFEFFDKKTKKWFELPRMLHKRKDFSMISTPDNSMYVIGGQDDKDNILKNVEKFDLMKNTWIKLRDMNQKRKGSCVICMPDGLYVIGGFDGVQYLRTMEKFDFITKRWTSLGDMKFAKSYFSVCCNADFSYIYAFGGYNGRPLSITERYDVSRNKWEVVKEIPCTRYKHNSILLKE